MENCYVYSIEKEWILDTSQSIITQLSADSEFKGQAFLGLSGGSTPHPVYQALQGYLLDWSQIGLVEIDERLVSPDSSEYNWRKIQESLGSIVSQSQHICAFDTQISQDPQEVCNRVDTCLPSHLSVAVLGLGEDGHFASIFPHTDVTQGRVMSTTAPSEYRTRERLTLTPSYILSAEKLILVAQGKKKKRALDILLNQEALPEEFPALQLLQHPRLEIHYLDI